MREIEFWLYNKLFFLKIAYADALIERGFWLYNKLFFLKIQFAERAQERFVLTLQQIVLSKNRIDVGLFYTFI